MDIEAKPGTKVRFNNAHGFEMELAHALRLGLVEGKEYTVERTSVHGFCTDVYLQEYPGVRLNSVMFDDIE